MLKIKSEIAYLAQPFVSREETRYYLCGFLVETNPNGGVNIVATDGHVMIVFHDPAGETDKPTIVQLNKDMVRACKPAKSDDPLLTRYLSVDGSGRATVHFGDGNGDLVGMALAGEPGVVIDGTYPDWRRVYGAAIEYEPKPEEISPSFAAGVAGRFASLAKALDCSFSMDYRGDGAAALVNFNVSEDRDIRAFGLAMPMRGSEFRGVPDWLKLPRKAVDKAA